MAENAPKDKPTEAQPQSSTQSPSAGGAPRSMQLKAALRGHDYETQVQMLSPDGPLAGATDVHSAAEKGISGSSGALPHAAKIQQSFGGYDLSNIQAHTGPEAQQGAAAMGADAYATGNHVVFNQGCTDLHTAAHEAAHVVQQSGGVALSGGVGKSGDVYEKHADKVADAVVAGESAEGLLSEVAGGGGGGGAVQMREGDPVGTTKPIGRGDGARIRAARGEKVGTQRGVGSKDAIATSSSTDAKRPSSTSNEASEQVVGSEEFGAELEDVGSQSLSDGIDYERLDSASSDPFALDSYSIRLTTPTEVINEAASACAALVEAHLGSAGRALENLADQLLDNASGSHDVLAAIGTAVVIALTAELAGIPLVASILVPSIRSGLSNFTASKIRKTGGVDDHDYFKAEIARLRDSLQKGLNGLESFKKGTKKRYLDMYLQREVRGLDKLDPTLVSGPAGRLLHELDAETERFANAAKAVDVAPYERALFTSWVNAHASTKAGGKTNDDKIIPDNGYIDIQLVAALEYSKIGTSSIIDSIGSVWLREAELFAPGGKKLPQYLARNHAGQSIWLLPVEKRVSVYDSKMPGRYELDFCISSQGEVHRVIKGNAGWEKRGPWHTVQAPISKLKGFSTDVK